MFLIARPCIPDPRQKPERKEWTFHMLSYYTSIILMCWLTLGALSVLIYKNNRMPHDSKHLLYLTYALIAVSSLAEWLGVQLNGKADSPEWILRIVKCADYILTPMAGGALVMQMRLNNRWQKVMMLILGGNAILQVISAFPGWMVVIDEQHYYSHGPLFPVYLGVCLAIYMLIILQFLIYGRSFRRQNRTSLYAVMLLVIAGISLQELRSDIRTAYLGMTAGAALMLIHYTEFSQLTADSNFDRQQRELLTDPLTGLQNRYSYSQALNDYSASKVLPEDFAAFTIDINDLKRTNDTMGHEAGDELIKGAAECIRRVFGTGASCYRTGGDEFVILAAGTDEGSAEKRLDELRTEADRWKGTGGQQLSLASGCALKKDHPDLNAEELVRKSDLAMYRSKAEYYQKSGHDRRKRR